MTNPLPYRNVVFDVGNVLLSWDPLGLIQEQLPGRDDHDRFLNSIFAHQTWEDLDHGLLEEEEANELFAERVGCSVEEIRQLILASKVSLKLIPETMELLEELHQRGSHLFALSNMSRGTFQFVYPRFPFWQRFEGMIISAFIRKIKPNADIFHHFLNTYQLKAEECFFIDDRPENVESARSVGMNAEVFTHANAIRSHVLPG